jgi:hypothetical protein
MKQAEIYPFQASDNKKLLYDKIATALNDLISDVTNMLDISSSSSSEPESAIVGSSV